MRKVWLCASRLVTPTLTLTDSQIEAEVQEILSRNCRPKSLHVCVAEGTAI